MTPSLILIKWLHSLATVIWLGGLFTTGVILIPTARKTLGPGPQLKKLMETFQNRLNKIISVSMLILVVTGLLLARSNPQFQGLFQFSNDYATILSVKHILILMILVLAIIRRSMLKQDQKIKQNPNPNLPPKDTDIPNMGATVIPGADTNSMAKADTNSMAKSEKIKIALIFMNIFLGVLVVLLSSITSVLG